MNEFKQKLEKWLIDVADRCHELASNPDFDFDLDFYVFQSKVSYNPKLMFIGANPGGKESYFQQNKKNNRVRRTEKDLVVNIDNLEEGENTFIKYYNDPKWRKLKPLYDTFKDIRIEQYFKDAVITNLTYFNSSTFSELKKRMKITGNIDFLKICIEKKIELIDIINPQNIILVGAHARDNFGKYIENPMILLKTECEKKLELIKKSELKKSKIPVFIIEHPSAPNIVNNKINVELKRAKFAEIFGESE